jgi:repressor LexA
MSSPPAPSPESLPSVPVFRPPTEEELDTALRRIGRQVKTFRETVLKMKRAPAAQRAGVSPKHLIDLEEHGANVSLKIIMRLAWTFGIHAIGLGASAELLAADRQIPAAPIERALEESLEQIGAAYEMLTGRRFGAEVPKARSNDDNRTLAAVVSFRPAATPARPESARDNLPEGLEIVRESLQRVTVRIAGEVSPGQPIKPVSEDDTVMVPEFALERDEVVIRVNGNGFAEWGMQDGELLILERRDHAANGELVLALVNDGAVIGRYWSKHGERRVIAADSEHAVSVGEHDQFEIYGAITTILRETSR